MPTVKKYFKEYRLNAHLVHDPRFCFECDENWNVLTPMDEETYQNMKLCRELIEKREVIFYGNMIREV